MLKRGFKCQCSECVVHSGKELLKSVRFDLILYPICYSRAHFELTHSREFSQIYIYIYIHTSPFSFPILSIHLVPLSFVCKVYILRYKLVHRAGKCSICELQTERTHTHTHILNRAKVSRSTYPVNLIADTQAENEFLFAAVTHWSVQCSLPLCPEMFLAFIQIVVTCVAITYIDTYRYIRTDARQRIK